MRIGIDLTIFRSYQGTEVFVENILEPLARQSSSDYFFVFKPRGFLSELTERLQTIPGVKIVRLNRSGGSLGAIWRQQILLPFLTARYRLDVLYSPSPFFSFLAPARRIATIHDCAYGRFKEFRSRLSRLYISASILLSRRLCERIATVSNFSRQELETFYNFTPDKVAVVSEGPPVLPACTAEEVETAKRKFAITKPYFFYIGITRPRKNILNMLRAFKEFSDTHPGCQMVLAGRIDTAFLDVGREIQELGLVGSVIQTDFVTNREKVALYRDCQALVYVSLYEGFGLPVLEAQMLGVPVVTSNTSSLPEVAGSGALFADPADIASIIGAMAGVMNPATRQTLIDRGYENIKRYSWQRSARELMQIIKSAA